MIPDWLKDIAKRAVKNGWHIEPTKSGHLKWSKPGHAVVITYGRKSSGQVMRRNRLNCLADLRRAGIQ